MSELVARAVAEIEQRCGLIDAHFAVITPRQAVDALDEAGLLRGESPLERLLALIQESPDEVQSVIDRYNEARAARAPHGDVTVERAAMALYHLRTLALDWIGQRVASWPDLNEAARNDWRNAAAAILDGSYDLPPYIAEAASEDTPDA